MAHNQGGLNGIESRSGVMPPTTSAVEKIPSFGDYNYTIPSAINNLTQFLGLTTSGHRANFSSTKFDKMFNDQNFVGGNMLTSDETMHQRYMDSGAGMRFYEMA